MNRNRCIALALCCLLLLALFGCAPSGTEQSPSGQPQSDAAGTQSPDGQAGEENPAAGEAGELPKLPDNAMMRMFLNSMPINSLPTLLGEGGKKIAQFMVDEYAKLSK